MWDESFNILMDGLLSSTPVHDREELPREEREEEREESMLGGLGEASGGLILLPLFFSVQLENLATKDLCPLILPWPQYKR